MNREQKLEVFKKAVFADPGKHKGWKQIQSRLVKSLDINGLQSCSTEQDSDYSGRSVQFGSALGIMARRSRLSFRR